MPDVDSGRERHAAAARVGPMTKPGRARGPRTGPETRSGACAHPGRCVGRHRPLWPWSRPSTTPARRSPVSPLVATLVRIVRAVEERERVETEERPA